MKEFIITLTRNIGKGKDIFNYFENRGCSVIFDDTEVFPKTIVVSTNHDIKYLQKLMYVFNVVEGKGSNNLYN